MTSKIQIEGCSKKKRFEVVVRVSKLVTVILGFSMLCSLQMWFWKYCATVALKSYVEQAQVSKWKKCIILNFFTTE